MLGTVSAVSHTPLCSLTEVLRSLKVSIKIELLKKEIQLKRGGLVDSGDYCRLKKRSFVLSLPHVLACVSYIEYIFK